MADKPAEPLDVLAVILARGGSVGLPGKNLRPLAGKPLIAHTIVAAKGSARIGRVVVSSDDDEIGRVARTWGAEFIRRPAAMATATAPPEDAVRHVLETLAAGGTRPRTLVMLLPTAPLRTAAHIDDCIDRFRASASCRSAVSVYEESHPIFNAFTLADGMLAPMFGWQVLAQNRQAQPTVYRSNGAIYVADREVFLADGSFYAPPTLAFVMAAEDSVDINDESDLALAEHYLRRRGDVA